MWRGSVEDAVYAFLDCGLFDRGFARVSCPAWGAEFLIAFSCQRRGLCPSCAAKRGALFGAFLTEEVVEDVGHCLWTFTIPKMLRVFFLHHRGLLGRLCRAGWEVVRELMATAVGDPTFQPGMVAVVQTYGDRLDWHPHVHAMATRGGWDAEGRFVSMPFVSTVAAERLLRHKVIALLRDEELLSDERIELLLSWRHSGLSAHDAVTVPPGNAKGIERLARYLLRSPVSLERLRLDPQARSVHYRPKSTRPEGGEPTFETTEFLARLLQHVPQPRLHQVRYYGYYANLARARRAEGAADPTTALEAETPAPGAAERRRRRPSWAQLIRRIYEVDPLTCTECGRRMRIIAFLLDPPVIRKILQHLATRPDRTRAPPVTPGVATAASR